MKGKNLIAIIVIISVVALIITWIYGQKIISDFDLDRGMEATATFSNIPIRFLFI